jgi:hypothetical protein
MWFYRDGRKVKAEDVERIRVGAQGRSGLLRDIYDCYRCGGKGGLNAWHRTGWTCFKCGGVGKLERDARVYTADKLVALNAAADARQARKDAQAAAERNAQRLAFINWVKDNSHGKTIGGILTAKNNPFMDSLAEQVRRWRVLSDKQMSAAIKVMGQRRDVERYSATSHHVGQVKERLEFEAVIVGVYETENAYGHVDIVKMRDNDGNLFTWFASGFTDLQRSDRVKLRGTVKKHDEYRGIKSTVITRCKYDKFEVVDPDASDMEIAL